MATEREALQAELVELRNVAQEPGRLRKDLDTVNEQLDDARAAIEKEKQRANGATNAIGKLQTELRDVKANVTTRTKEVAVLKKELENGDQKSVRELMQREKAAESAMLRKAREIGELQKKLANAETRVAETQNDAVGLQREIDLSARNMQKMQDNLRREQQTAVSREEDLERANELAIERQTDLNSVRLRLDSTETGKTRVESEVRALQKGLDSAKGEGSDAAAKVSELERQLSLRTDEVTAAQHVQKASQAKLNEAQDSLYSLKREAGAAKNKHKALEQSNKEVAEQATKESQEQLDEAKRVIAKMEKDISDERSYFEREKSDIDQVKTKELSDMERKLEVLREDMANANVSLSTERREHNMQLDQTQDSLIAKEREIKTLSVKMQAALQDVEDSTWHLERANAKIDDVKVSSKQTEDDLKRETHELRGQVTELTVSTRDAERRARSAEGVAEDSKVEVDRVNQRVATSTSELSEVRSTLVSAVARADEKQKDIDQLQVERKRVDDESKVVAEENNRATREVEEKDQMVSDLRTEVETAKRVAGESSKIAEGFKKQLESLNEALSKKEKDIGLLNEDVKKEISEREELVEKVRQATELRLLVSKHEMTISEMEGQLSETTEESSKVESRSLESAKRIAEVSSQLKRAEEEREESVKRATDVESEMEKSKATISSLEGEIAESKEMLQKANDDVLELRALENDTRQMNQSVQSERDEAAGRIAGLEKQVANSSESHSRLQKTAASLESKLAEVETVKTELKSQMDESVLRGKKLQACLNESTGKLTESEGRLRSSEEAQQSLELDVSTSVRTMEEMRTKLQAQAISINEREGEVSRSANDLADSRQSLQKLEEQLTQLSSHRDEVSRDGASAMGALQEAQLVLENERQEREAMESMQAKAEEELANANIELDTVRKKFEQNTVDFEQANLKIEGLLDGERALNNHVSLAEEDLMSTRDELVTSQGKVSKMESHLLDKQKDWDAVCKERDEISKQVEKLSKDLEERRVAEGKASSSLEGATLEVAELKAKNSELGEEASVTAQALEHLREKVTQEGEQHVEEVRKLRSDLEARVGEVNGKGNELKQLQELLSGNEEEMRQMRDMSEELESRMEGMAAEHDDKLETVVKDRDEIAHEHAAVADVNADLTKRLDEADEAQQTLSEKVEETRMQSEEFEGRSIELDEELSKVANDVTDLEWSLNEQTLRADQAEKEVEGLRDQGRNIYAQIEEFGEEAEARVLEAENELQGKMEEIAALESRIAEMTGEIASSTESVGGLKGRIVELESEHGKLTVDKETAERRLELTRSEGMFQTERIGALEKGNRELLGDLEGAKSNMRDAEDRVLRLEKRIVEEQQGGGELQRQVERLRAVEMQMPTLQGEVGRLKVTADEAERMRGRMEVERDALGERLRMTEDKFVSERRVVAMEHRLALDDVRRGSDMGSQHLMAPPKRPSDSGSVSSRRTNSSNVSKGNLLVGATAAVGGMGLFALRLLSQKGSDSGGSGRGRRR